MKRIMRTSLILLMLSIFVSANILSGYAQAQTTGDLKSENVASELAEDVYDIGLTQIPLEDISELLGGCPSYNSPAFGSAPVHGLGGYEGNDIIYDPDDEISFKSHYSDGNINLKCLYIGSHCTVWGQTNCDDVIKIDTNIAKCIGAEFDKKHSNFAKYFGEDRYDYDNDGKIAILCHDIFDEYAMGIQGSVENTWSGYFWRDELWNEHMDCIHIDTYPSMGGKTNLLGNVKNIYPTMFHEYQHFINCSKKLNTRFFVEDEFTDEAMSMAAEHLLYGYEVVTQRIKNFNEDVEKNKRPVLVKWDNTKLASNYGYAYLWGQYIRTRYAQLTGKTSGNDAGAQIYKELMNRWNSSQTGTVVELTADIIYENDPRFLDSEERAEELIKDFWIACIVKAKTGKYGFNNEKFANAINIKKANVESDNIDLRIILTIGQSDVMVYGEVVKNDVAPKIVNDRTMVPIRIVAEALGAEVKWYNAEQPLEISKDDIKMYIKTGSYEAEVDGKTVELDSPAFVENDRAYIPLRFVSENLGAKVEWDSVKQQIIITK